MQWSPMSHNHIRTGIFSELQKQFPHPNFPAGLQSLGVVSRNKPVHNVTPSPLQEKHFSVAGFKIVF
jgi:hypothetical protein